MAPSTMAVMAPTSAQPKVGTDRMPRIMAVMAMPLLPPSPEAVARRALRPGRAWPQPTQKVVPGAFCVWHLGQIVMAMAPFRASYALQGIEELAVLVEGEAVGHAG